MGNKCDFDMKMSKLMGEWFLIKNEGNLWKVKVPNFEFYKKQKPKIFFIKFTSLT